MVEAANSIRRHEDTYRLYYQKKYDEVPKFKHKRALVLTARKLVRLVDTLLRNHQLYTPERSVWIVNTKLNNFFKGILTIFNWG